MLGGMIQQTERAYIGFGIPDGKKLGSHHVGYKLNIEWLNREDLRIFRDRHVDSGARRSENNNRWTDVK